MILTNLFLAGLLAIIVGLVHSFLGETMIFNQMRSGSLIPTNGEPLLREPHVRILWATWHIATLFGFGLAAVLFWLAYEQRNGASRPFIENTIAMSMLASAILVLFATKGRHPGWIGLLAVAVLCWLG